MKISKNQFQHLTNNNIEADWTKSLYSANASFFKSFLRQLMMVQHLYLLSSANTNVWQSIEVYQPTVQVCTVQSYYGPGVVQYYHQPARVQFYIS